MKAAAKDMIESCKRSHCPRGHGKVKGHRKGPVTESERRMLTWQVVRVDPTERCRSPADERNNTVSRGRRDERAVPSFGFQRLAPASACVKKYARQLRGENRE